MTQSRLLTTQKKKPFVNIVGKGENAGNQHFLLVPTMFSTHPKNNFCFEVPLILSSENALNLKRSKILSFGKVVEKSTEKSARFLFTTSKLNSKIEYSCNTIFQARPGFLFTNNSTKKKFSYHSQDLFKI